MAVLTLVIAPIGISSAQTTVPERLLLERFKQIPTGPVETSRFAPSPVDVERQDLGAQPPRTAQPPVPIREETARLERDYANRLRLAASVLGRLEFEVPGRLRPGAAEPSRLAEPPPPMLRQFGYRMLGNLGVADGLVMPGVINDSYHLGIGDELIVTFRGQNNESYRTRVDREGRVVLPKMTPFPAAGLTFGEFRAELERKTSATFLQTLVFVSLGEVRNFPVMVLGQVNRPGVHRLSGVATVLDAIVVAGGVQKTGSLRNIQIVRGTESIRIDLYDLLLTGQLEEDLSIMEGDRVFVPPLGGTIAVAGEVKLPGIYELDTTAPRLTVSEAIGLAGGTLQPEGYLYLRISSHLTGTDHVSEISDPSQEWLQNGDILLPVKASYAWEGAFFLEGHVSAPGPRALTWDHTIGSVLTDPKILHEEPYLLLAAVETTDPDTLARYFVPVDLARIMAGKSDMPLSPGDRLIVLGAEDIRFLSSDTVQAVLEGQEIDTENCRGLQVLASIMARSRAERFANARLTITPQRGIANFATAAEATPVMCPKVFNRHPGLLPFVLDFVVAVRGEVRNPGVYPIMPETPLGSVVPIAGGLSTEADVSQIEVTHFVTDDRQGDRKSVRRTIDARSSSLLEVAIAPGDVILFNPRFSDLDIGNVVLTGEFRRPGIYNIRRGERLSEIIHRVGGLTEQAYPLGAVFTRTRVQEQETKAFKRAAVDLESSLAETLARTNFEGEDPTALVAAVTQMAQTLRTTRSIGRVVVESDPTVLGVRPELDTILEPGDRVHMPKRPNNVTVSGEVLSPGTMQFRTGKRADQYIAAAGGISRAADDDRTFLIFPNGEARPISVSAWNYTPVHIPPGSTIVVPRDPKPFDLLAFSLSITDILSKLAITAASLVVIGL